MSQFLEVLHDKDRGRPYRIYAGISMDHIPCEGTFSYFRLHLGETLYKEKIFGYNLVLSTSVELHLKIELPVAVTNISGNAEEGAQIIENKEQIHNHHKCQVKIDIADAKYDIISNYNYIRAKGSIPIIDYNRRNEDLSKQSLLNRGYDQKGWPFAPCGLLTRPNGFDQKHQRLTFCCFKQCMKLRHKAL